MRSALDSDGEMGETGVGVGSCKALKLRFLRRGVDMSKA